MSGQEGWRSTRRWAPVRRIGRVLAWPAWVVAQLVLLITGDLFEATPKRQKLNKADESSHRARLAPNVLGGYQRDRQADYFGNSMHRVTGVLFLPDGLLDADERGFRWSPFGDQVRDVASSWGEVARLTCEPIETRRHALTIWLSDGSRIGLVADDDPAQIEGFDQWLTPSPVST